MHVILRPTPSGRSPYSMKVCPTPCLLNCVCPAVNQALRNRKIRISVSMVGNNTFYCPKKDHSPSSPHGSQSALWGRQGEDIEGRKCFCFPDASTTNLREHKVSKAASSRILPRKRENAQFTSTLLVILVFINFSSISMQTTL